MKANVYFGKGDARLIDIEYPEIQGEDEVVLKIRLSTICGSDVELLKLAPEDTFLANPGNVIGHEFVGEVVEIGTGVKGLKVGDRVAGNSAIACGKCENCRNGRYDLCQEAGLNKYPGFCINGCQAEYMRYPLASDNLHVIPDNVTDEQALFAGDILATGYVAAERASIKEGSNVAIFGCGPVALCAMQCSRLYNPAKIIAVGGAPGALKFASEHNLCDEILNYREIDIMEGLRDMTDGKMPDCCIVAKPGGYALAQAVKAVKPGGIAVSVGASMDEAVIDYYDLVGSCKTIIGALINTAHVDKVLKFISEGKMDMSYLITHKFPLNDIEKAYDVFGNKKDRCIKVAITPYQKNY